MTSAQRVTRTAGAACGSMGHLTRADTPQPAALAAGPAAAFQLDTRPPQARPQATDLFIWFEDTSQRNRDGRRGIAGLPESLLPWPPAGRLDMRMIDCRYADGHVHLLAAVRLRCNGSVGERIASIYTAALSVGTVAWIGAGNHYERAWEESAP